MVPASLFQVVSCRNKIHAYIPRAYCIENSGETYKFWKGDSIDAASFGLWRVKTTGTDS